MAQTIDSLEVRLQTNVVNMGGSIDMLARRLENLKTSVSNVSGASDRMAQSIKKLAKINAGDISMKAVQIRTLADSIRSFETIKVNTAPIESIRKMFNSLATGNIETVEKNLSRLVPAIGQFAQSMTSITDMSAQAESIGNLANAFNMLGRKNIDKTLTNLPKLATELRKVFEVLSSAPNVSEKTIRLVEALGKLRVNTSSLSNVTRNVGGGFKSLLSNVGKLRFKFVSLASIIGTLYANFFLLKRVVTAFWKASENAMNYIETYNYFAVALGKIAEENKGAFARFGYNDAEAYAESFSGRLKELTEKMSGYEIGENGELFVTDNVGLGLNPSEIMGFQARISSITNSVGMLGEASVNTAESLSMLAYDLSSLTNTDVSQVMTNLQSGITGSARALYRYGIDTTNASLGTLALELGIEKAVAEMSQNEKMQLRVIQILRNSKVAWGDQANTLSSAANMYRVLKQQIANLGTSLGALLLPIITKTLPYLNALVIAINRVLNAIGVNVYGDTWWKDLMSSISAYNPGDDNLFDDLTESAEDTIGAVKQLKNQLRGFDELNNLTSDNGSSKSGGVLGGLGDLDLSDEIKAATDDYKKIWEEAYNNAETSFGKIADKIQEKLEPIQNFFSNLFSGNFEEAGKNASEIAQGLFDLISEGLEKVPWDQIGQKIGEFLNGIEWGPVLDSAGNFIVSLINSAIDGAQGIRRGAFAEELLSDGNINGKKLALDFVINGSLAWRDPEMADNKDFWFDMLMGSLDILTFGVTIPLHINVLKMQGELNPAVENILYNLDKKKTDFFVKVGILKYNGDEGKIASDIEIIIASAQRLIEHVKRIAKIVDDTIWNISTVIGNVLLNIYATIRNFVEKYINTFLYFKTEVGKKIDELKTILFTLFKDYKLNLIVQAVRPDNVVATLKQNIDILWGGKSVALGVVFPAYTVLANTVLAAQRSIDSMWGGKTLTIKTALDTSGIKNTWNYLATVFNNNFKLTFKNNALGNMLSTALGNGTGSFKLPTFFNGGYTPSGSLFMAGENGVPELMGTIGGRNAVASGSEITGIKDAIVEQRNTEAQLLSAAVSLLQVISQKEYGISDRDVLSSVQRSTKKYNQQTGRFAF